LISQAVSSARGHWFDTGENQNMIIFMNGPFHCPWLTFAAVLVAFGSVLAAIIWALLNRLEE
jgi:hypothetical protein